MSQEEADRSWAEGEEAYRLARDREKRREHRRHQLGIALIWLSSMIFAFGLGDSQRFDQTAALIWVGSVIGALFGGLHLLSTNRHRRDQDEH